MLFLYLGTAINICVHMFVWTFVFISLGYIISSKIKHRVSILPSNFATSYISKRSEKKKCPYRNMYINVCYMAIHNNQNT